VVVVLVAVGEGVVDTDVGQAADEDQGRGPQPLEEDFEIRAEEARVPTFGDAVLAILRGEARPD
jgi:hypothetical protein